MRFVRFATITDTGPCRGRRGRGLWFGTAVGVVSVYDDVLAMTGLGTAVLGPIVFDVWWLAVVGVVLALIGVTLSRFTRRRRSTP
jgi:hypothetical protein